MNHFFAYISRMKLIQRWSLMQNIRTENVQEHSLQVAVIAHALALIKNEYYSGDLNPERAAVLALFHDASEVFTGDMPTPAKYFSEEIREAYKKMERSACEKLLEFLPPQLRDNYRPLVCQDDHADPHLEIVKAADSICAYLKCLEETAAGNQEFNRAKISIETKLKSMERPEVEFFLRHFATSFSLTIDELGL